VPGPIVIVAPGAAALIAVWMLVYAQPLGQTVFIIAEAEPADAARHPATSAQAKMAVLLRPMGSLSIRGSPLQGLGRRW
jgi:hypothetical protein